MVGKIRPSPSSRVHRARSPILLRPVLTIHYPLSTSSPAGFSQPKHPSLFTAQFSPERCGVACPTDRTVYGWVRELAAVSGRGVQAMPRIPAALAIVAIFAACIGLNVARYPEVREMAANCEPALKLTGPKRPAPAEPSAGSDSQADASGSAKPTVAYCTLEGVCYGADGKPVSSQAAAPDKAQPGPKHGLSAASTPSAAPPASPGPPVAQSEPRLIPIVRVVSAPGRPGATGTATGSDGTAPEPTGGSAKRRTVERLPRPEAASAAAPAVSAPDLPGDSIPIYPTTAVQ